MSVKKSNYPFNKLILVLLFLSDLLLLSYGSPALRHVLPNSHSLLAQIVKSGCKIAMFL